MKKTLAELAEMLDGSVISGNKDTIITDITQDSREAGPGALFVCVKGAHVDGHRFIPDVIAKGAVAIMTESDIAVPDGITVLRVVDLDSAIKAIVPFFFEYPGKKMRLIGITGTNGKTTTSYLIRDILRKAGYKTGVIGTIRIMIEDEELPVKNTTPDVIALQRTLYRMYQAGIEYVVMEVSSHALAMDRVIGCEFDTAVFTNLTQDHLDYHKTMENYAQAKARLFSLVSQSGQKTGKHVVVNIDDPAGQTMLAAADCQKFTYGVEAKSDLQAKDIQVLPRGAEFSAVTPAGSLDLKLKITGMFNVYNVLGAVGAALAENIDPAIITETLNDFCGVSGRFELVDKGQPFAVIVDYAHTPDGLENILKTARQITKGKIITVFGCGGDRDRTKRPIMGRIAAEMSDVVIATSDNPRSEDPALILKDVMAGVEEKIGEKVCEVIADRKTAIFRAIELAKDGDTVVIAGKGHENYQILKDKTIHFDDKEVASEALGGVH